VTSRHPNDPETSTLRVLACVKCGDRHTVDVGPLLIEARSIVPAQDPLDPQLLTDAINAFTRKRGLPRRKPVLDDFIYADTGAAIVAEYAALRAASPAPSASGDLRAALAFIQEAAPLLTASMTDPKMVTELHRLMYRAEVLNIEAADGFLSAEGAESR
jgi:hypothetical protein